MLFVAACGRVDFDGVKPASVGTSDALPALADGFVPCTSFGAWSAPALVTELNSPLDDWGASITADGLAIYFQRDMNGMATQMLVARRPDRASAFGAPTEMPELEANMPGDPSVTSDELEMFFDQDDGSGKCVHRATRDSVTATWNTPTPVASMCGTTKMACPWVSADGLTLYVDDAATIGFASRATRSGDFPAPRTYVGLFTGISCPSVIGDALELYVDEADLEVDTRASTTVDFTGARPRSRPSTRPAPRPMSR